MNINRSGSQSSTQGPAEYFTGKYASTRCSKQPLRHAPSASVSRSSPTLEQHDIPIRWAKP